MAHPRAFRFAAQLSKAPAGSARSWAEQARKAEDLGYSTLLMPDHFGDQLAPIAALMAAAAATTELRVGALVFDNDYRHPLVLAKEAATLDLLSDGRLELGLGAGWMRSDYEQSGIAYDAPAERVDRFEEGLTVITGLLEAEGPFHFAGRYYTISEHTPWPRPVQRPRPPIIIGGGGRRMLTLAGRHADIVSINVDLRSGVADVASAKNASPDQTLRKVLWVQEAAGERFEDIELNTLIGFAMITDDAMGIAKAMAPNFGMEPEEALHVPLALVGTLDQMTEELRWRRDHYGISYYSIEADIWDALGPVVARLAGT
ncbi:MAG TPA: TIGR03621 family F420-dependent LLM class oxidoreductase [Acidimicrobiales bacterium]|nr:TIGR03621 family F420-dependent LLM class oxidoreductase [Acidimicrobiales bacterium]